MKQISYRQQIDDLCCQIEKSINEWSNIKANGCSDPNWADGCNMNLVRNHITYYKKQIEELCEENHIELPSEYFLPTPPEVDNGYMADMTCQRAKKLISHWCEKLTHKCPDYASEQLSLF